MGVYVYAARKSNPIKSVMVDGSTQLVHRVRFFCKLSTLDSWGLSDYARKRTNMLNSTLLRIEKAWGAELPKYVVFCDDKLRPYPVHNDTPNEYEVNTLLTKSPVFNDAGNYCTNAGKLVKKGKRYFFLPKNDGTKL